MSVVAPTKHLPTNHPHVVITPSTNRNSRGAWHLRTIAPPPRALLGVEGAPSRRGPPLPAVECGAALLGGSASATRARKHLDLKAMDGPECPGPSAYAFLRGRKCSDRRLWRPPMQPQEYSDSHRSAPGPPASRRRQDQRSGFFQFRDYSGLSASGIPCRRSHWTGGRARYASRTPGGRAHASPGPAAGAYVSVTGCSSASAAA